MNSHFRKRFPPKPQLGFIAQFSFSTALIFLTSGVFLSGLAVSLGAGDVLIGYITAIPNICGVLILAFSSLVERVADRKKLAILLTVCSRLATLWIVLIPRFSLGLLAVPVFVVAVVTAFTLQAQTTVVVNNWMIGFIDGEKRGRYISQRQTASLIVTVILSLAAGRVVDRASSPYAGLLVVFGVASLMAVAEVILLLRIPTAADAQQAAKHYRLRDIVTVPMKNKPFMAFVIYVSLFYFLLYISDSFTVLYMMRYLDLPYATITGLQMLISLPQVVLLRAWGHLSDKRGHRFVLASSIWLFSCESLFLALSNADNHMLMITLAFLLAAVANSGFTIAVFNRRYELMPIGGRILHDNFYSASIGIAFILGPVVGAAIKDAIAASPVFTLSFGEIRILYMVSMLGILLLQLVYTVYQRRENSGCSISACT